MKCDNCEHMKFHDTGIIKKLDDLTFFYCEKNHWEFTKNKSYIDCIDFKEKITKNGR